MTPPTTSPAKGSRAWGWVAHLREGGTTPWHDWSAEGPAAGPLLPGAQQLELLRRLNLAAPAAGRRLADRILAAVATGRGRPDLELVGVAPARPFGFPPVDPSELSDGELLRVAVGLVADVLAGLDTPSPSGSGYSTSESGGLGDSTSESGGWGDSTSESGGLGYSTGESGGLGYSTGESGGWGHSTGGGLAGRIETPLAVRVRPILALLVEDPEDRLTVLPSGDPLAGAIAFLTAEAAR